MSQRRADASKLELLIRSSGLSYRTTSRSFVFKCPLCNRDGRLYMFRDSANLICVKCRESRNFQGAPEFALTELTGRSIKELQRELYGVAEVQGSMQLGMRFDFFADEDEDDEVVAEAAETEIPAMQWDFGIKPLSHPVSAPGRAYLAGRGVDPKIAEEAYGVRYDVEKRAVAFPAIWGGVLVGWQTRVIDPLLVEREDGTVAERVKAMSTSNFPRDRVLMFGDRLKGADHAVLCEGPVDAIACHLVGGNVASAGAAVAARQAEALIRSGVTKIYLALDPDAAGEVSELVKKLDAPGVSLYEVVLPKKFKDLGEMVEKMGSGEGMKLARDVVLGSKPVLKGAIRGHMKASRLFEPRS